MIREYILLVALIACLPAGAYANGILLTTSPEFPRDGETVVVTARPIGDSPALVEFTWTVDDEEVLRGYGASQITVDAPKLGESTTLAVTARIGERIIGSNTLDITPARVTIEWESDGFVPATYRGRPLVSAHGLVRFVALPEFVSAGTTVRESDLVYTWSINGKVQASDSGYGKSVFTTNTPFFNTPFSVSVTVRARDSSLKATDSVRITPVSPRVLIYETAPLTGVQWWRAVEGEYQFTNAEVSFIALPTFVAPDVWSAIVWQLNGTPLTLDSEDTRTAVFKKTGTGSGSYRITAGFENPFKFLEFGSESFLLHF